MSHIPCTTRLRLRHISIRVPWHDTGWDGRLRAAPWVNGGMIHLPNRVKDRPDRDRLAQRYERVRAAA
jgi:hypothetical protein